MLDQSILLQVLIENGVEFFTGVPDSYLNGFCNFILDTVDRTKNIIAANEGNAIGIASGYYFATGKIPLVYMQNSGIGNAINPLASLVDENVYGVPMILLIGWRGPGENKHPQHKLQGEITLKLLEDLKIPYLVLEDNLEKTQDMIISAINEANKNRKAFALIAPKGVMAGQKIECEDLNYPMSREEAIEIILDNMPQNTLYVATTGRTTRELFFIRERRNEDHYCDFLNVGAMGHASSVALGMAINQSYRDVVVLDGDAANIMHMGAMTMVSKVEVENYLHIVLNNGSHDSVGGQPSTGYSVNLTCIAEACGYNTVGKAVETKEELSNAVRELSISGKASFIDVRIHKGLSKKYPILDFDHREMIDKMMENIKGERLV